MMNMINNERICSSFTDVKDDGGITSRLLICWIKLPLISKEVRENQTANLSLCR